MRDARQAALTGKAGEFTVAAQLLIRGVVPHWPAVDVGCDLATDVGCRIQVRCAHLFHNKSYGPLYFFPLPKKRVWANSSSTAFRAKVVQRKPFIEVCDFVIFWGIEQNRFWVVPASLCDQCTGVELGIEPKLTRFEGSLSAMREMKALGYSNYKIAKHYGIQQTSVKQFLESGKDSVRRPIAQRMRAYEGRWDLIVDFGQSAAIEAQAPDTANVRANEEV